MSDEETKPNEYLMPCRVEITGGGRTVTVESTNGNVQQAKRIAKELWRDCEPVREERRAVGFAAEGRPDVERRGTPDVGWGRGDRLDVE